MRCSRELFRFIRLHRERSSPTRSEPLVSFVGFAPTPRLELLELGMLDDRTRCGRAFPDGVIQRPRDARHDAVQLPNFREEPR